MTTDHVHLARRALNCWRYVAIALAILPLTVHAINKNNIGRAGITQTGRTTTITPGAPPANSGGSTIPVSPTSGGWSAAGNYGVPPAATGPTAGLNVNGVFIQGERGNYNIGGAGGVQGVRYPVSGSYSIPWSTVAPVAAGIVCAVATAGACGVASAVAAASPYIIDWMGKAGLFRNPETGNIEQPDVDPSWPRSDGYKYATPPTPYFDTREESCHAYMPLGSNATFEYIYSHVTATGGNYGVGNCYYQSKRRSNGQIEGTYYVSMTKGEPTNCPSGWYKTPAGCVSPANLPRIAATASQVVDALSKVNPDPRVWGEVLEKGGEIPMPNPVVTGPTQIPGPETVKQNQDGTREVSRTTYNFTTNGNQVTNTSNVTTTNIFNSSNTQVSSTTTTTTPSDNSPGGAQEEQEDACTKHPEALGCQKIDFDTPDGEIPKKDKQVTYAPESVLTGGSCPAPRELAYGRSFSYAATCDALTTYVRPMVIAIAGWIAIVIIFGVGRPE